VGVFDTPMSVKTSSTFIFQDSIPPVPADSVNQETVPIDTSPNMIQLNNEEVSSIFEALDRKEKELDSLSQLRSERIIRKPVKVSAPAVFDTSAVPYNTLSESKNINDNPLTPFKWKLFQSKDTSRAVFIEESPQQTSPQQTSPQQTSLSQKEGLPVSSHDLRPDWLLGVILICLILIAWLKLFYNKFLNQIIQSLTNFQLSAKLFRDQNIFTRRVSFVLNLNFVLAISVFIYLSFGNFNIIPFKHNDFISLLIYIGAITGILLIRYIVLHLVGYIFNKQREFQEYLHEILMIYKNLGIFLIPLIFGIAYIHEDVRIYLFYLGGLMIFVALIIRIVKGFKILINKDVLIFYLILYLCTLEILPLLIFYRFFSLSVLTR
jgi:hypothetical protein